jgi:hypothetical protein
MDNLHSTQDVVVEGDEGRAPVGAVRLRRARAELEKDDAWLRWISRFAGVTLTELAVRFQVSSQAARRRARRLREAGLLRVDGTVFQVTPLAARLLFLGSRRRIHRRVLVHQRDHEAAIVSEVTEIELLQLSGDDVAQRWKIWTERDIRRRERAGLGRYSVDTLKGKRWPDVVLERDDGLKRAVEFEFTPKHRRRVEAIVFGYHHSDYANVYWYVLDARVAKLLVAQIKQAGRRRALPGARPSRQHVSPWSGLSPERAEQIRRRVPETRDA